MTIKIDFEVNETSTYCDKTMRTADIGGMPYPLALYILFGGIILTWLNGFSFFLLSLVFIYLVRRTLKKLRLRPTLFLFYIKERSSSRRRALPARRYSIVKQEVDQ